MTTQSVTITSLGAQGDGLALIDNAPVHVGFALPGERITIEVHKNKGHLVSIDEPSAQRVSAPCPYFGPKGKNCGGCALQHLDMDAYNLWKRQLVVDALSARGIEVPVDPIEPCLPGSRRRAVFTVAPSKTGLRMGFNQAGSHTLVEIDNCAVLTPGISGSLERLRALAKFLVRGTKPFKLHVLETLTGLDVSVENISQLSDKQRQRVTEMALQLGFSRLSLGSEILVESHSPTLKFADVQVAPPPGSFVQSTIHAQNFMSDIVADHMKGAKRVADLFSGCGTFTFALARHCATHAVEAEAPAVAALDRAARHAQGLKPITTEQRDLYRRPLQVKELKKINGVVFDPPRAGAEAQAQELAASKVSRIAAVSCNPATLARDLRHLIDGGFKIKSVKPVDQFLWSPHVEVVVLLER